jgi:enterochelin esterase-like enzyme
MKLQLFIILVKAILIGGVCFAQTDQPAAESQPSILNITGQQYPRVDSQRRAIFRIYAPQAQSVRVGLGNTAMTKGEDGYWNGTTSPLDPGFHYYQLIIDDVSVSDPATESFYGTGKMSSAIEVPDPGVDFHFVKDVPHGNIRTNRYYSKRTGTWRRLFVYTPPGYDTKTDIKYPVLYIQHGAGEDERCWGAQGRLDNILDNLIAEGKTTPMLVVMTNEYIVNDMGGSYNTEPFNRFMDLFKDELFDTIIPFVESNYRALSDRESRAIAGLSMGGGFAFRIGMLNTEKFAWIGVFSSSAFRGQGSNIFDAEGQIPGILTNPEKFNKVLKLLYISTGQQDRSFEYTQKAVSTFREKGLKVENSTFPGAHEWHVWRKALHDFAPRIFK